RVRAARDGEEHRAAARDRALVGGSAKGGEDGVHLLHGKRAGIIPAEGAADMSSESLVRRRSLVLIVLPLVLASEAACSRFGFFKRKQGPPNIAAEGRAPLTVPELQFENLRFADTYTESVAQGADRVAKEIRTPEAQVEALKWKLEQATSAYVDATGQNPV